MKSIYLVLIEMIGPADTSASEIGFMNITTWAESAELAELKIKEYLGSFGAALVGVEKAEAIDETDVVKDEDLAEMIEKTRSNPDAIILGTFHTYPPE
jgi:hypothetical protein